MSWIEDRDQLIADTLAFVTEVSGDQPELAAQLQTAVALEIECAKNARQIVPPPNQLKPLELADLREDIRARVAAFRAQQQTLQN
jgi:hypothetical protein